MKYKKILTDFFMLMAFTTTLSFVFNPNPYELVISAFTNLSATILKLGEGRILSTEMTAASFVADAHLIPALFIYFWLGDVLEAVSLAVGAVAANIVSIILAIIEAILASFYEEE